MSEKDKGIDFKDYFSLNSYKEILENYVDDSLSYSERIAKISFFSKGIISFLKDKKKEGSLVLPLDMDTHDSYFLNDLKKFNKDDYKYNEENITNMFNKLLLTNILLFKYKDDLNISEEYEKLIEIVNKGNFNPFDLDVDSNCYNCGQKFLLISRNWKFKLATLNKDMNYELMKPCIDNNEVELNVNFTSGKLLIADWIRIEEFTSQVEYNKDYKDLSINYKAGKIKSSQHAEKLGFITIHVGNSSPTIYKNNDNLIFAYNEEDEVKGYEKNGYVCTDLWNVTIIDEERLIEIISEKTGKEKAEELVKNYLKNNDVNVINVTPGEYKIKFKPDDFIEDEEIKDETEIYFSMKRNEIKNQNNLKKSKI